MASGIDRRAFLAAASAVTASAAGSAIAAGEGGGCSAEGLRQWAYDADVVVIGSGLSGCVTAITAHDSDPSARILVIEKMPERWAGGNSRVAGQSLFFPTDLPELLTYRRALDQPNPIPEPVLKVWAEAMVSQHDWIRGMMADAGYQLVPHKYNKAGSAEYPNFPGASAAHGRNFIPVPVKSGVWQSFKTQADRRAIQFMYETRAVELVQVGVSGEIAGVLIEQNGRRLAVRARRAVVMCTGGFENNLDMHRNYTGMAQACPLGTPGNTGDGIKMLQKVGADLWHLRNSVITSGMYPAMKFEEFPCGFLRVEPSAAHSWIDVAKDDRRFWNETRDWNATHYHEYVHGNWVDAPLPFVLPVHMIFDESVRKTSRLSYGERQAMTWNNVVEQYVWSADNSVELAKGWILKGETLAELALKMGRDPARLERTVAEYNNACDAKRDPEHGRDPETLQRIEKGPFYAVELFPGVICTTGGAKRNERAQVLGVSGKPIPRLYSAGELGSIMGNLYQNGSFLTECIVFGRIAGTNAIAEKVSASG